MLVFVNHKTVTNKTLIQALFLIHNIKSLKLLIVKNTINVLIFYSRWLCPEPVSDQRWFMYALWSETSILSQLTRREPTLSWKAGNRWVCHMSEGSYNVYGTMCEWRVWSVPETMSDTYHHNEDNYTGWQ